MKRGKPIKRGKKRIKPMSDKRKAENEVRKEVLLDLLLERGNQCEAQCCGECGHVANDAHEKKRRSAGGSIVDPDNIILVCRQCHDWIHGNPLEARQLGLLESRYDAPRETA